MGTLQSRVWRSGELEKVDFPLTDLRSLTHDDDALVWFDLFDPDPVILSTLAQELDFDRHSVEDALEPYERPKATRHRDYIFLTCYAVDLLTNAAGEAELATPRVSAFVLPNALITVRSGDYDFDKIVEVWETTNAPDMGVGALLHGMLDVIVDGHFESIQVLDDQVDDLEDLLFRDTVPPRTFQKELFDLRKILTQLRRKVSPMRELVASLMRFRNAGAYPKDHRLDPYFEDLYDHVHQSNEWIISVRDAVSNAHETSLSLQDVRMNEIMKKLAAWAAIIAVPTAVTGYFGQNIPFPTVDTGLGVIVSTLLIIFGAGGLYVLFRKIDWL